MNTPYYILDEPLPLSQDFKSLKDSALSYIHEHIGNEWTNLNPGDPGMTILDQVCFALTELGYCNEFPLSDILTGSNEKLLLKDQFYLPQEILTTSPVTKSDYRKYIIDGVDGVNNVIVIPVENSSFPIDGIYLVYLLIDKSISSGLIDNVCEAAYVYLNKRRNLGEIFLKPRPLLKDIYLVEGKIEVENENNLNKILEEIQNGIQNFIFPKVLPGSYSQLFTDGVETNEIFNGPLLKHGWISTQSLGKKRKSINLNQLVNEVKSIAGVISASFSDFFKSLNSLTGELISNRNPAEMIEIDFFESIKIGKLVIECNGKELSFNSDIQPNSITGKLPLLQNNILFGASVNLQSEVPVGKFRDINSYYSIQNTFPEVFAVGHDATISNASDFQIAQSRQLKGYLTIFDQVLANQFSQLANIDKLFSFRNPETGTPSDMAYFLDVKDHFEQKHLEYPVPYMSFSPTYFYQSLYNVPHIKPLLKDNSAYYSGNETEPEKETELDSWNNYKRSPYNLYIRGLMEFMEEEKKALERRNNLLDHLLARHGESPLMIDSIINGSVYSSESLKDKVVFKSLYLQNLGLLSYYRQKAYNYQGAYKIAETNSEGVISVSLPKVSDNFEQKILGGDTIDFIFNSGKINKIEKLSEQDFINYSAVELKLCMLFGLKVQYLNFISSNYKNEEKTEQTVDDYKEEIEQALWLIEKRKGVILVETALLLKYCDFEIILKGPAADLYWQFPGYFNYETAVNIDYSLLHISQPDIGSQVKNGSLMIGLENYALQKRENDFGEEGDYKKIPGTNYSLLVKIKADGNSNDWISYSKLESKIELIFPDFIPQFKTPAFFNRLEMFLQNTLPVVVTHKCHFVDSKMLEEFIPVFIKWHESIRFGSVDSLQMDNQAACAKEMIAQIGKIYAAKK